MTPPIEPARTFCGVPFCSDPAALAAKAAVLGAPHGTAAKASIIGAAFVEYVPERDPDSTGAQAIARLASNVIVASGGAREATQSPLQVSN